MRVALEFLDPDACRVVERLQQEGYTTYLVGGCVRDMLIAHEPKDFDIATSAQPEDLKRLFGRRCRVIGRRFELAQVRCGTKLMEVATFRGRPESQETADDDTGFVIRANTYGSPEEDARSRDFTINGLFYDPVAHEVIDFIEGRTDITRRQIRTIGEPAARFREDPVRILRAIKFAARLNFELAPDLVAAAQETASLLLNCPTARVTEELFRILETGHLVAAVPLLRELGVIEAVIPEILDGLDMPGLGEWLEQIDIQSQAHGRLPRESLFALAAWPAVWSRIESLEADADSAWGDLAIELVEPVAMRLTVPVRCRQRLRATLNMVRRQLVPKGRRRRVSRSLARSPALSLALTILRMRTRAGIGEHQRTYDDWAATAWAHANSGAPFESRYFDDHDIAPTSVGAGGQRPRGRRRRPTATMI